MSATTAASPILQAAREAYAAGLCVVPVMEDGSKAPIGAWKQYQQQRPTVAEMRGFHFDQRQGLGVITGKVSGNVEQFEFDDRAVYERFIEAAEPAGLGELVARIRQGYEGETPGNGIHWLTRCEEIAGNTTLARRPQPDGKRKALIQTRGEGGFTVEAPSHGRVHPTGKPYRLVSGSFATIATLTPDERRDLWQLARSFDEVIRPEVSDPTPRPTSPAQGERPGDLFNATASWSDILTPHGWTLLFHRGGVAYWRRPGKDHGISATTNWGGYDYFYVFTTSTEFDEDRGYTRFSVYATLEHGGDFGAAARALRAQGFGGRDFRPATATLGGQRVDVATPGAVVDDTQRALDDLRARVLDMERRFRQREEEWSALGQHLGNENISPTDRIILYKLASEALSRPEEEDGYRLIRIGETQRKAQRAGREGYGLAAVAGIDESTIGKALKKYAPPNENNEDGWGLIGRRDEKGRHEDGTPRSDIRVRLPADRLADVMISWRGFAPDQPRNHGGRRVIEVPEAVAAQPDPVSRDRQKMTRWRNAITGTMIIEEIATAAPDFWTAQGEELAPEEVATLRQQREEAHIPEPPEATGPTVQTVLSDDDEPDDWDPYECNAPDCRRRPLPDKRYCADHDPERLARFGQRTQPATPVADAEPVANVADAAPVVPPFIVHPGEPQGISYADRPPLDGVDWGAIPLATADGVGYACGACGEPVRFARTGKALLCPRCIQERNWAMPAGGDLAAGGGG